MEQVSIGKRLGGYLIDYIVAAVPMIVLSIVAGVVNSAAITSLAGLVGYASLLGYNKRINYL
jgi:hypothetical protein